MNVSDVTSKFTENKTKLIVGLVLLLVGAGLGRYASPAKVEIKTETVEVEKIVEKKVYVEDAKKKKANKRQTHTIETTKPDGTKTKETFDLDESTTFVETHEGETTELNKEHEAVNKSDKTVTNETKWQINALAGADIPRAVIVYGAQVEYRVLGPIFVGGFGLTSGVLGVSSGISF